MKNNDETRVLMCMRTADMAEKDTAPGSVRRRCSACDAEVWACATELVHRLDIRCVRCAMREVRGLLEKGERVGVRMASMLTDIQNN